MAKKPYGSGRSKLSRWRIWIQSVFLLAWLDPFVLRMHTVCSPVFHCYSCPLATFACPIGILANFSAIHMIPLMALGTLMVVGGLFGSLVCGWVCPFGLLQDLLGKIPTPKFQLPDAMGYMRYVMLLALVVTIPYLYGESHPLFICRVCPAGAIEAALPNMASLAIAGKEVPWPSAAKIAILVVFLGSALFVWRPWCTLFCPLGAVYGLFNYVSLFFVRFHAEGCTDCDLCGKLCRSQGRSERRASDMRCIRCLECMRCDALSIGTMFGNSSKASDNNRRQPPTIDKRGKSMDNARGLPIIEPGPGDRPV